MKLLNTESIYPGWRVLAGAFISGALGIGFCSYIFGMFVIPVTEEFGISRATFNNGFIAFMLGNLIAGPFIGIAIDRYSIRRLMIVFGVVFGAVQITLSRTDSLPLMIALMLPLSFSTTVSAVIGANTLVARWFQARRGKALGVLALSVTTGGVISQPLTALLIENLGWRDALLVIGLSVGTILTLAAIFLVRDRPDNSVPGYDNEFSPAPASKAVGQPHADTQSGPRFQSERTWSIPELLRCRNFWLLAVGVSLLFGTDQAVLISQVAYFQDMGIGLTTVGLLVMVKGISAGFGKLVIGLLADRVDLRFLYAYVALSSVLLLTVYCLQPGLPFLFLAVALLGVAVGGVYPVWTTLMAWLFGARSYGTVMGLVTTLIPLSAIISTRFIGEVYDRTGSYVPAFMTFVVVVLFSILLIAALRPEHTRERKQSVQTNPEQGFPTSAAELD